MKLSNDNFFHIYNRGNNKQAIFFDDENYLFFLHKLKKHLGLYCDIICYCLMSNHFHLLLRTHEDLGTEIFSKEFATALRSYTRAINKQKDRCGSLFQQNTHSKLIRNSETNDYLTTCFNYIHYNPVEAGLVQSPELYKYSSIREYLGESTEIKICNTSLGREVLSLPESNLELIKLTRPTIIQ